MKILVLNAGSSSVKFQLFNLPATKPIAKGNIQNIGENSLIKNHKEAFSLIKRTLIDEGHIQSFDALDAIGHRVVHGGSLYSAPTRIDDEVLANIKKLIILAPLHNGANALGIATARTLAPNVPNVAVFDTAFHQSMPPQNYLYAIPLQYHAQYGVRKYGFHGTSHAYVAQQLAKKLNKPLNTLNIITMHLGNGASMCAIQKGKSIDTTMGFTPLEGLVMGSRSGDIDASVVDFLADSTSMSYKQVNTMLNTKSGLKGLTGDNNMQNLLSRNDTQAVTAIKLYVNRIIKYLGAYMALLGHVDAVVFTGGVGENAAAIRNDVLQNMHHFGIQIDTKRNQNPANALITSDNSPISAWVIATNEELSIALQTQKALQE